MTTPIEFDIRDFLGREKRELPEADKLPSVLEEAERLLERYNIETKDSKYFSPEAADLKQFIHSMNALRRANSTAKQPTPPIVTGNTSAAEDGLIRQIADLENQLSMATTFEQSRIRRSIGTARSRLAALREAAR